MQSQLSVFICITLFVSSFALSSYSPEEYLAARRLNSWRNRNDFERFPAKRSRMCLINAGLSQGCDLSDIIMAKQQANKFMSFAGPGRR